jgi:hypothetical protein
MTYTKTEKLFSRQYGVRTYYFKQDEVRVIAQWNTGEKGLLLLTPAQAEVEIECMLTENGFYRLP